MVVVSEKCEARCLIKTFVAEDVGLILVSQKRWPETAVAALTHIFFVEYEALEVKLEAFLSSIYGEIRISTDLYPAKYFEAIVAAGKNNCLSVS